MNLQKWELFSGSPGRIKKRIGMRLPIPIWNKVKEVPALAIFFCSSSALVTNQLEDRAPFKV